MHIVHQTYQLIQLIHASLISYTNIYMDTNGVFLSLTETEPTNQEQWNNKANEKIKNMTYKFDIVPSPNDDIGGIDYVKKI